MATNYKYSEPETATVVRHKGRRFAEISGSGLYALGAEVPAEIKSNTATFRESDSYDGLAVEFQMPDGSWQAAETEFFRTWFVTVN